MKTSKKLIGGFVLFILLSIITFLIIARIYSENNFIEASGNILVEERNPNTFSGIDVNNGIRLYLQQGEDVQVKVEADENILPNIKTFVEDDVLKIRKRGKIKRKEIIKVYVTVREIRELRLSSGAKIKTTDIFEGEELSITCNSGAIGDFNLNVKSIELSSSSGSVLNLAGKTEMIKVETSSGSSVNAESLEALYSDVTSSSGAMAKINVQKELSASASSGAQVIYIGSPEIKKSSTSSGGKISQ